MLEIYPITYQPPQAQLNKVITCSELSPYLFYLKFLLSVTYYLNFLADTIVTEASETLGAVTLTGAIGLPTIPIQVLTRPVPWS